MVNGLRAQGALTDPCWYETFRATPRHVFTPVILDGNEQLSGDEPSQHQRWLSLVYRDDPLVTATFRDEQVGIDIPTISSTKPSLMARMLETLDFRDEMSVLEIGTGTGYNAALLCHRLGDKNVTSVDIDSALVERAGRTLRALGYRPFLRADDGTRGVTERAPFDRIIATCAVPAIPIPWVRQLAPGGRLLVNLRGELAGGTLCLLTKDPAGDDEVIGPFLDLPGRFMWARASPQSLPYRPTTVSERYQARTVTDVETVTDVVDVIDDPGFRFLVQLQAPGIRTFIHETVADNETALTAQALDGSFTRAYISGDRAGHVTQSGPRRLWDSIEATHALWHRLGRPQPSRFGIVANPFIQFAYLDDDGGWLRWPLPLL